MSRKRFDPGRRKTARIILATAAIPLTNLWVIEESNAAGLPHLSESDPAARALHYVHNAGNSERSEKNGVPGKQQHCSNCRFIQSEKGEWRPCQIFPGKLVNENGWCMGWLPGLS